MLLCPGSVCRRLLLAGVVNALAGGGLLFTFPALVALGVLPVAANATANIAPGGLRLGGSPCAASWPTPAGCACC